MATETPLIHDGAQTVAGQDFRNSTLSGSTRLGPSGSGQFLAVRLSTTVDRTVNLTTADGANPYGILQNKPSTGVAADVGIFGVTKAIGGSTLIVPGMDLMASSSGALIPFSAGANIVRCARALEAAPTFGQLFTAFFYGVGGVGSTA